MGSATIPVGPPDMDDLEMVPGPPPATAAAVWRLSERPIPREDDGVTLTRVERVVTLPPPAVRLRVESTPPAVAPEEVSSLAAANVPSVAPSVAPAAPYEPGQTLSPTPIRNVVADSSDAKVTLPLVMGPTLRASVAPPPSTGARVLPSAAETTVYGDVHDEAELFMQSLLARGADEEIEAELLKRRAGLLPHLLRRFPGPLLNAEAPRVTDVGPVLRLLVRVGEPAVGPLVAVLAANDRFARAWALRVLGELPFEGSVAGVTRALFDDDPLVRQSARVATVSLVRSVGDRVVHSLAHLARDTSELAERRIEVLALLADGRRESAVPLCLELLADADRRVAAEAHEALTVLTRQDFDRDATKWRKWWEQNQRKHRVEWLIDALTHTNVEVRRAAAQELRASTREYFGYAEDLPPRERARAQQRYRDWWWTEGELRFRQANAR
jgi:hypothetical protein